MTSETTLFDRDGNRKYLNTNERERFYMAAMQLYDVRHRAFVLTIYYTGCRISEALALTSAKVDQTERLLILKTLKQREKHKIRAIPIPDELLSMLVMVMELRGSNERIWPFCRTMGWKIIKHCMASAGLTGIKATPKGLRHGFAIACVSAGVPLPTLQRWLGHASMNTTSIYLEFVGEDERKLAERVWFTPAKEKNAA